jgi:ribonuclease-3
MLSEKLKQLEPLQATLAYRFRKIQLLVQALTHRSHANENPEKVFFDNERFEFLGDAVLNAVITHLIMEEFPDQSEGYLTRLRASMVNKRALARMSKRFGLGEFIFLGKGERERGGREKPSILANCYEAVAGAVYMDGGYEAALVMLASHFSEMLKGSEQRISGQDFKTLLQKETQKRHQTVPRYVLLEESGPDHEKRFRIRVSIDGEPMGCGEGKTKKEAEQSAAEKAFGRLMTDVT